MQRLRSAWVVVREAAAEFSSDDVMSLAASISFYAALSLAPLAVVILVVTSVLAPDVRESLVQEATRIVGDRAGEAIGLIVEGAAGSTGKGLSAILAVLAALVSATGVFAQLQVSLNRVWGVQAHPRSLVGGWLRKRAACLAMVLALCILLFASLLIDAAIGLLPGSTWVWGVVHQVVALAVFAAFFAWTFRTLPDVKIGWQEAWIGAIVTAPLFLVGRWAIGIYLGKSATISAFGAAGSLIALLVWIYYTSIIFLFGAEITETWARRYADEIVPDDHAVWANPKKQAAAAREKTA